jgi:hypothetical protein
MNGNSEIGLGIKSEYTVFIKRPVNITVITLNPTVYSKPSMGFRLCSLKMRSRMTPGTKSK